MMKKQKGFIYREPGGRDIPFFNGPFKPFTISKRDLKRINDTVKTDDVPYWELYSLTVEQASKYFNIGQTRLRTLIHMNPNADYILMVGSKYQIKRKQFERFLNEASVI